MRFLQLVCRELGLNNVEVVECDLEKTAHLKPLRFDNIVARAVAPMEQLAFTPGPPNQEWLVDCL